MGGEMQKNTKREKMQRIFLNSIIIGDGITVYLCGLHVLIIRRAHRTKSWGPQQEVGPGGHLGVAAPDPITPSILFQSAAAPAKQKFKYLLGLSLKRQDQGDGD